MSAAPGGTLTVSTTVTGTANGGPYGLEWLIYDPSGTLQSTLPQMSTGTLTANTSVPLAHTYTVPSTGAAGTWTVKARVLSPDYTTTTYTTDASAVGFTVQVPTATGGNSTVTSISSVATIILPNDADPTSPDGFLHQAATLLTPTDPKHPLANSKSPVMTGIDLGTLKSTTLATDVKLDQIIALLSRAGSLSSIRKATSLLSDPMLGDPKLLAHASTETTTDTGWLPTGGLGFIVLELFIGTMTAASGNGQVEFWVERQLGNGQVDPTPILHLSPTPNQNQTI